MVMSSLENHNRNHYVQDGQGRQVLTPRMGCEFCTESERVVSDHTTVKVQCSQEGCQEFGVRKTVRLSSLGNNVFAVPFRYVCGACGNSMTITVALT